MKKLLSSLLFIAIIMTASAQVKQDTSQHLTFKGVPLDGTLEQYVLKMKQNGFKHLSTKDGVAMLQGDFAGYKDCFVGVSTLKQKDMVYKIGVVFPEKETWSTLSGNYFELKNLLIEKYGTPSECVEIFQSYTPESDGSKMTQVRLGACKYYASFETVRGTIHLAIEHEKVRHTYVKLTYIDKINGEAIKKQALDDL